MMFSRYGQTDDVPAILPDGRPANAVPEDQPARKAKRARRAKSQASSKGKGASSVTRKPVRKAAAKPGRSRGKR